MLEATEDDPVYRARAASEANATWPRDPAQLLRAQTPRGPMPTRVPRCSRSELERIVKQLDLRARGARRADGLARSGGGACGRTRARAGALVLSRVYAKRPIKERRARGGSHLRAGSARPDDLGTEQSAFASALRLTETLRCWALSGRRDAG